jgi:hypothetical protein
LKFETYTPEQMDEQADHAQQELSRLDPAHKEAVSEWWRAHYLRAGHRSLGRVLLEFGTISGSGTKKAKSDEKVRAAKNALDSLCPTAALAFSKVRTWYRAWFLKAGHRRLGRILSQSKGEGGIKFSHEKPDSDPTEPPHFDQVSVVDVTCNIRYKFQARHIDSPALFTVRPEAGMTLITINRDHPAGETAFDKLSQATKGEVEEQDSAPGIPSLLLLLFEAWAMLESETPPGPLQEQVKRVREDWGRTIRSLMFSACEEPSEARRND